MSSLLSKVFGKSHNITQLRILLISDIHLAINLIQNVKDSLNKKNQDVDLVLLAGDICNLKDEEYEDNGVIQKAEDDIQNILWSLEQITSKVYYIPGNHDPKTMFDKKPQLTKNSVNMHKNVVQLAPGLLIAGFGGSVPSYYAPELRREAWKGYPFTTEEKFEEEWDKFLNQNIIPQLHNNQLLLMTHVGPSGSDTVKYNKSVGEVTIMSGSDTLQKCLRSNELQEKVVVNVHGHTHIGRGQSQFTNIPIVNPGSLRYV
jgi:Icc-related predicted phosphoesterase